MTVRPGLLEATLPTDGLAGSFIDGAWLWPADGRTLVVENPSRRTPLAEVGRGTAVEIDLAVAAARRAQPAWRDFPASARGRL